MATKDGKKTGGRQKGTPNKESPLEAMCKEQGVNFFQKLIDIAKDAEHPRNFDAIKEGCGYVYAKKTALKISGDIEIALVERAKAIKELPTETLRKMVKSVR